MPTIAPQHFPQNFPCKCSSSRMKGNFSAAATGPIQQSPQESGFPCIRLYICCSRCTLMYLGVDFIIPIATHVQCESEWKVPRQKDHQKGSFLFLFSDALCVFSCLRKNLPHTKKSNKTAFSCFSNLSGGFWCTVGNFTMGNSRNCLKFYFTID